MKVKLLLVMVGMALGLMSSCSDDESFSTSSSHLLSFSADTVNMDTVFSTVPSAHKSLWVYNRSGDGLRCRSVRLERGARSGFRVNVNGQYLSESMGYSLTGLEVRNKDSVRVFVEVTPPVNNGNAPQLNDDNLVFTLESGVEQKINLKSYSWDAVMMRDVHVTQNRTISSEGKPIVVYGGITVEEGVVLTIAEGTVLYFHNDAGIHVRGSLKTEGTAARNVVLRGDRIDRMFSYLPYDYVPGQWKGIRFYDTSKDNVLTYTDIHGAYDGVVVESQDVVPMRLTLENVTIHNCQGYGLMADNARIVAGNTQVTNTLKDCVLLNGGDVTMNNCTLAQFYPFDSNRGVALRFTATHPLTNLSVSNSLITGYADNMLSADSGKEGTVFNYLISNSILRQSKIEKAEEAHFKDVVFEDVKDTKQGGDKHFARIDTDSLRYDFRLKATSLAVDKADKATATPSDRNGTVRDALPDVGAFEYVKP